MSMSLDSANSLCAYKNKVMKKKTGPRKKITKKDCLSIKRVISKKNSQSEKVTSQVLLNECDLNANVRTVQKYLKYNQYVYKKWSKQIILTTEHKEKRLKLITSWIVDEINFNKVVFSDEKRFNLDGPDD